MFDMYMVGAEELLEKTKVPVLVLDTEHDVFLEYAIQMITEINENNKNNKNTVFIIPCGPMGQYPVFAKLVNRFRVDLKNTYIIHMDEYVDENENCIPDTDYFSFKKAMQEGFYDLIDNDLVMPEDHRIFPDPADLQEIPRKIRELGGVDIAFGGVALNGHIAFNEPHPDLTAEELANLSTRIITLNFETRVKDAILSRGGAIDTVPTKAITIGMKEILGAKKVRLSMMLDMQRAVIRKGCLGDVSADCPLSLVQRHEDALLMVSKNVVERPFGE